MTVVSWLIDPIGIGLWVGILSTSLFALTRVSGQRVRFGRAIHTKLGEIGPFFWIGIPLGLLVTGSFIGFGLTLTAAEMLFLGIGSLILSLLAWRFATAWWLGLVAVIPVLTRGGSSWHAAIVLMLIVGILWLASGLAALMPHVDELETPVIRPEKRHQLRALFRFRQLFWIPLLIPVTSSLPWPIPVFQLPYTQINVVAFPLIIGFAFTAAARAQDVLRRLRQNYFIGGGLLVVLGIGGWFLQGPASIPAVVILVVTVALLMTDLWQRSRQRLVVTNIGQGVAIIGVVSNTPAAKMALQPGDRVLECNHQTVHTSDELYAALQTEPTYCRLRLRQADGEVRLAETAIYEGAPHEIGIITFPEETA